ncbi:enoyl-CoA hydratase-related protein [uncultured Mameliella sp.]|uniref:enoyl-CoA hydratase/isomerase family protein n=1 Tax=uncultured Mameliella sp. TaxID=1447087 RepID=UPI0026397E3A|nr:enoyl-CoA hydratase-related protein [uncultured Mameliella sp.]
MVSSDHPGAAPGRVAFDMRDGVAALTIENPPENVGSLGMRRGVVAGIAAAREAGARGAVLIGAGRSFFSGSDLRDFGRPLEPPEVPEMIARIEQAPFPVVAALQGEALSGGLELALGCDWRIAAPGTRVGLPEVSLGFVPGAGGTQRLPRLVGQSRAIDLICLAARIPSEEALDIGLIDAIVEGDLLEAALAFLSDTRGKRLAKTLTPPKEPPEMIDAVARKILARCGSRPNLAEAIRLVRASTGDADATLAEGRVVFHRLRLSKDAFALRHLFFAERKAATVEGLDMGQARDVTRVGVVGGGTMGQGIARAFLAVDLPVTLVEQDQEALTAALDPEVAALIEAVRAEAGITPRSYDTEAIQRQLLAAIVNEAACLLDEGIAQRASDVDVVLTNGDGFPRWSGGPLYWAAPQARSTLEADLADLAQAIGHGFRAGPVARTLDQIATPLEGQ